VKAADEPCHHSRCRMFCSQERKINLTDKTEHNVGFLKDKERKTYTVTRDILVGLPPFPNVMLIELTNACNHGCSFCFNKRSTRKRGMIDGSLLASVLRDAYELGTREAGFYATGESLMYSNIEDYIRLAKQLGYEYIYLSTNGALLSPGRAECLISAGIDSIKFSINAATRETYRLIHGRDDFDKVMENLRYLREYRDDNDADVKIGVSCILTNVNHHEKSLAEEMIGRIVDDIVFHEEGNQGGYMNRNNIPQIHSSVPCSMLFNRFHISHEGYFTLCCMDYQNYLAVADLNKVSLHAAWESEFAVSMREKHLTSKLEGTLCHNCTTGEDGSIEPLVRSYCTVLDAE